LKPKVLSILEGISEDENLSLSKICSLLIEEALVTRGAYSKTSRMSEILPSSPERDSLMRKDSLLDAAAAAGRKVELVSEKSEVDDEDLKLLKKIKMLKELNLL
jgi:hypothetical protein